MTAFALPAESTGEIAPIDSLENPSIRRCIAHWRALKGARVLPARSEIALSQLGPALRNLILVKVLEGGADYEYRIVGEALLQGFKENFTGKKLSQIIQTHPQFGLGLKMLYDLVRTGGQPLGYRGRVGQDMQGAQFVYHENAILPFGAAAGAVDYLLIVSVIILRPALVL